MDHTYLYPRNICARIQEAVLDTPVVLLAGPRQSGKTTLMRQLAGADRQYLTLDDDLTLLSARSDPAGFVRKIDKVVIDEIQRAPQLLLAIKKSVDEDRRPGRFLLTGSANLMTLPTVADSLAGRMETLSLMPLSQSEIEGQTSNWLDQVFNHSIPVVKNACHGEDLNERVLRGGYPEALTRNTFRRRTTWARQYIESIIARDVRDIAGVDKLDHLPRLLTAIAQTASQPCNYAQLGAQIGLDSKTTARYIGIFEQMYLMKRVGVWSRNRLNRVTKTPKVQLLDAGLLACLTGLSPEVAARDRSRFGKALETFVYGELLKHASAAEGYYTTMFYRDADQVEVDFVVEDSAGRLLGIEVKAAATVTEGDLKGLRKLARLAGDAFHMGIILYDGDLTLPVGDRLWAAPLASLWGQSAKAGT